MKKCFPPFALHIGQCPTMLFISIPGCQALWTLRFWALFLTQEAICVAEFWATYRIFPLFSCSNICSSFLVAWTQIAYMWKCWCPCSTPRGGPDLLMDTTMSWKWIATWSCQAHSWSSRLLSTSLAHYAG
jgi:hypothetical protein